MTRPVQYGKCTGNEEPNRKRSVHPYGAVPIDDLILENQYLFRSLVKKTLLGKFTTVRQTVICSWKIGIIIGDPGRKIDIFEKVSVAASLKHN